MTKTDGVVVTIYKARSQESMVFRNLMLSERDLYQATMILSSFDRALKKGSSH